MTKPTLVIGNRNYSSWSLRPHMALAGFGIDYKAQLVRLDVPGFAAKVKRHSKAGLVPVLKHKRHVVWDTLAIMEYLAETWPRKAMWPKNKAARAMARSISAEMHSGFRALREACPMNLHRPASPVSLNDAILKDVARIEEIWAETRRKYGKGGPFLFGKYSLADAMFAPVVTRFDNYAIPVKPATRRYMNAIMATPAFTHWKKLALKEKWLIADSEAH